MSSFLFFLWRRKFPNWSSIVWTKFTTDKKTCISIRETRRQMKTNTLRYTVNKSAQHSPIRFQFSIGWEVSSSEACVQGSLLFQFIVLWFVFRNSQDLQVPMTQNTRHQAPLHSPHSPAKYFWVGGIVPLGRLASQTAFPCHRSSTWQKRLLGVPAAGAHPPPSPVILFTVLSPL